jgi:hypothetical protein
MSKIRRGIRALVANRRIRLRPGDRIVLARMTSGGLKAVSDVRADIAELGEYEVQLLVDDVREEAVDQRWN